MDRNLLGLISHLRLAGIKISTGETIDCFKGLDFIDTRETYFKEVLKSLLIKRAIDIPVFEKVFTMYYSDFQENLSLDKAGKKPDKAQVNTSNTSNWKNLLDNIKDKNNAAIENMVESAVDALGELKGKDVSNFNNLVRRTQISLEWFMAENQLDRAYNSMSYEEWLEAKEQFELIKEKIEDFLRKKVQQELGSAGQEEVLKQLNFKNKDFGELRDEEITEMEKRVVVLGKKLASKAGRRKIRGKKGIIDMRRLIKKATQNPGSIPFEFSYLKRKPAKPKIAVLCDISGSVAKYSRFMLQLVYLISNRFPHIKAYVFVDDISEVTDMLKSENWEDAFNKIFRESKCSISGYSDYGKVFENFNLKYYGDIDIKTSVVILGDARNNWFSAKVDNFKKIQERSKAILWLNPQAKSDWDKDDSIISDYARYTRNVQECRNLSHLEEVVKKILDW